MQKGYSDEGLCSYTVSSLKAVRGRYILFVLWCACFFPPAIISWAL